MPKPPTLQELKERPCSQEELQLALVHLIELHNKETKALRAELSKKQDSAWRATL